MEKIIIGVSVLLLKKYIQVVRHDFVFQNNGTYRKMKIAAFLENKIHFFMNSELEITFGTFFC